MKNTPSRAERRIERALTSIGFIFLVLALLNIFHFIQIVEWWLGIAVVGLLLIVFALFASWLFLRWRRNPASLRSWGIRCLLIGATLWGVCAIFVLAILLFSQVHFLITFTAAIVLAVIAGLASLFILIGLTLLTIEIIQGFSEMIRSARR